MQSTARTRRLGLVALAAACLLLVAGRAAWAQELGPRAYVPFALWGGMPDQPTPMPPTVEPGQTDTPPAPTDEPPWPTVSSEPPPASPTPEDAMTEADAPIVVVPKSLETGDFFADQVFIREAEIEGDVLSLRVQFGGGCRTHDFYLVASSLFMESEPPQVNVLLSHDGHGDLCRAFLTEDLAFDLGPLKRKDLEGFTGAPGTESGSLILRLEGHDEPIRYDY